jgi:RNA-directed DNA polymerase
LPTGQQFHVLFLHNGAYPVDLKSIYTTQGRIILSLREKAAKIDTLHLAWESIKKNPRSYGIDEKTIEDFKKNLRSNLRSINHKLRRDKYAFQKLRGYRHEKDGKQRILKISTIDDRIVQKAILITIKDKFPDPECSYGYVEDRTIKGASDEIHRFKKEGFTYVLEADIVKFFDRVDKKLLLKKVKLGLGNDHSLDKLLRGFIYNKLGNQEDFSSAELETLESDVIGMPQGGNLSPLCANIYLNSFDNKMLSKGYRLIRYADDFIILCRSLDEAKDAHKFCSNIIEKELKLELHPLESLKTRITNFTEGFKFLGLSFKEDHVTPSHNARTKLYTSLGVLLDAKNGLLALDVINKCSRILTSWGKHYMFCTNPHPTDIFFNLDRYISRKLSNYLRDHGLFHYKNTISVKQRNNLKIPFIADLVQGRR